MENLVLAASNHASFLTSTWSAWASAPHDLLLVTEVGILAEFVLMRYPQDGFVGAHCGILLPLSVYCSSIFEAPSFAGPTQVIEMNHFPRIANVVESCFEPNSIFHFPQRGV